jgi:hypothetical protein
MSALDQLAGNVWSKSRSVIASSSSSGAAAEGGDEVSRRLRFRVDEALTAGGHPPGYRHGRMLL